MSNEAKRIELDQWEQELLAAVLGKTSAAADISSLGGALGLDLSNDEEQQMLDAFRTLTAKLGLA